jgi:hypothetical protein
LTIGFVSSALFLSGLAAQSADPISSVVKGVSGIVSGTVDAAGNVVDASGKVVGRLIDTSAEAAGAAVDSAASATGTALGTSTQVVNTAGAITVLSFGTATDVLAMSLDSRRADIDRLIANGVIATKVNQQQAADLRAQLDRLAQSEAEARLSADSLTFDEAIGIARELDSLGAKVGAAAGSPPLPALVVSDATGKAPPRMLITTLRRVNTPLSSLGDIVAGTVDATGIITDASGKPVGKVHPTTASKTGDTTFGTTAFGVRSVADLLGARRAELESLVALGESSGKLSAEQAAAFRLEFHIAGNTEEELRSTEGVMTFDEAVIFSRALDELSTNIGKALGVRLPTLVVKDATGNIRLAINTYKMADMGAPAVAPAGGTPQAGDGTPQAGGGTSTTATANDGSSPDATAGAGKPATSGAGQVADDFASNSTDDDFADGVPVAAAPTAATAPIATTAPAAATAPAVNGTPAADGTTAPTATALNTTTPAANAITSAPAANDSDIVPIGTTAKLVINYTPDNIPATWWAVLESRRMQLEQSIGRALGQGVIHPRQAADLRTELFRITNSIFVTKSDTTPITMDQAAVIAGELDRLAARVVAAANIAPFPKLEEDSEARLRIVLDNFGDITKPKAVRPLVYVVTLDSRRDEIDAGIASAVAAGKLTQAQAAEFRKWVNRIAQSQRVATTSGGMTDLKAAPVAVELDLLASRLNSFLPTPIAPLVVGTRFMLVGNQVIMLDETTVRRSDIDARINRDMLVGRLTAQDAAKVRTELDSIGASEEQLRADGTLDTNEMMTLFASIDRLDDTLNRYIASSNGRTQSVLVLPSSN